MFKSIAERSEVEERWKQAETFHKAVFKAEEQVKELEGYVREIEDGSQLQPGE